MLVGRGYDEYVASSQVAGGRAMPLVPTPAIAAGTQRGAVRRLLAVELDAFPRDDSSVDAPGEVDVLMPAREHRHGHPQAELAP